MQRHRGTVAGSGAESQAREAAGREHGSGLSARLLPASFYRRVDVVRVARELLGQRLMTRLGGRTLTGGLIAETEAYAGATDRASHAYGFRRTRRTAVMYAPGGVAYVYLCYGLHALFNVITAGAGVPHAVLIRALRPTHGVPLMMRRRHRTRLDGALAGGPGSLAQALGIGVRHSGVSLLGARIWIERGVRVPPGEIRTAPRVGVAYAGPDARRPWRFIWIRAQEGIGHDMQGPAEPGR